MRRNTRIMLVFGLIWFCGVMYYAKNANQDENHGKNPKHAAHKKREHGEALFRFGLNFFLDSGDLQLSSNQGQQVLRISKTKEAR